MKWCGSAIIIITIEFLRCHISCKTTQTTTVMVTVWALGDGDNRDGEEGWDDSDDGKYRGKGGTIGIRTKLELRHKNA